MYYFKLKLPTVLLLPVLLQYTCAFNLESAKEQTCFPINKTADVDLKWMMSIKEWYYPIMNRYDLYLTGLELADDPSKLTESQLYYEGCIKLKIVENGLLLSGLNGKEIRWDLDPPVVNESGLKYRKLTLMSGFSGKAYTTLTDNSTFSLFVACWDDNQVSWGIISTLATLPKETVKVIHEHAESLGLKREYFEEIRYGYCKDERINNSGPEEKKKCEK